MKKIKLDLNDLKIDSFVTNDKKVITGTINGMGLKTVHLLCTHQDDCPNTGYPKCSLPAETIQCVPSEAPLCIEPPFTNDFECSGPYYIP